MIEQPNCSKRHCVHFIGVDYARPGDESSEVPVCTAFPKGIPVSIAYGPDKHLKPVKGDNGITYEKDL